MRRVQCITFSLGLHLGTRTILAEIPAQILVVFAVGAQQTGFSHATFFAFIQSGVAIAGKLVLVTR
jgi:hypothetical protein